MNKKHLPMMGVGPIYVTVVIVVTIAGMVLSRFGILPQVFFQSLKIPVLIVGISLMIAGALLWLSAIFLAKIDDGIINNNLITSGVYAWVRNPIYSAFLFFSMGALLIYGNVWLLILPFVYWIFLTVLMKGTEEKWLKNLHGMKYDEYCKRVNRCIPWFPKKQ